MIGAVETIAGLISGKTALVAGWLGLVFVAERYVPQAQPLAGTDGHGFRRLGRNLALWAINTILSPLIVLPVTAWAAGNVLLERPAWWSGWWGLGLDLIVLDGLIYWWHRANHELPPLWRFHEVHHLDRFLDSTSALRFHFGEVLLSAAVRAGAILLLGFALSSILVFETILLAATIFHHSNLSLPPALERALAQVIVTPSIHWVHHHKLRADTDSNYSTVFSFWDRLFGTRSPTQRSLAMPIGVEGQDERPLAQLFLRPFRPRR